MEWILLIIGAVLIVYIALYFIIKIAVKTATKEAYQEIKKIVQQGEAEKWMKKHDEE